MADKTTRRCRESVNTGRRGDAETRGIRNYIGRSSVFFIFFLVSFFCFQSCSVFNSKDNLDQITVVASSSFSRAFEELTKAYTTKNRAIVIMSYDATQNIAKQIENGAPFDVFVSADLEVIAKLRTENLIVRESEKIFARGSLVLWLQPSSKLKISKLEDLSNSDITRIAIANPEIAPYGRAAVDTLKKMNLWEKVKDKVIYGQNVTQVKQYAETGNVDLAFVALAIVKDSHGTIIEVDEGLHQPLDNSIAIIKDSESKEAAQKFIDFVLSDEGKAILKKYGYR